MAEPYAHLAAENGFFRADFRLLTPAEGGRDRPLVTGDYRVNWSVDSPDARNVGGAPLITESGHGIELGETVAVRLFPFWREFFEGASVGTELFAFEGAKLVGKAVVTEIVPPAATTDSP
jgi:hypothetical protein